MRGAYGAYAAAIVISVAGTVLLLHAGGIKPPWYEVLAGIVSAVIYSGVGIAIGTGSFFVVRRWIRSWIAGPISCWISGILGAVVGIALSFAVVGPLWNEIVFSQHSEAYPGSTFALVLAIYGSVISSVTAAIFGLGLGQPIHRPQPPPSGETT